MRPLRIPTNPRILFFDSPRELKQGGLPLPNVPPAVILTGRTVPPEALACPKKAEDVVCYLLKIDFLLRPSAVCLFACPCIFFDTFTLVRKGSTGLRRPSAPLRRRRLFFPQLNLSEGRIPLQLFQSLHVASPFFPPENFPY